MEGLTVQQILDVVVNGFATVGALAALAIFVTGLINKLWVLSDVWAQVRSILVGAVLGTIGSGLHLGMFNLPETCGEYGWPVCGAIIGLFAGFQANAVFNTEIVQAILIALKLRPPQDKKVL